MNLTRFALTFAINLVACLAVAYLFGACVTWSWNPGDWSAFRRFVATGLAVLAAIDLTDQVTP